jgi:double-strand break repair protein MRE11
MSDDEPVSKPAKRGTAGGRKTATAKAPAKKAPARKAPARGRGRKAVEQSEEEDEDVVMESEEEEAAPPPKQNTRGKRAATAKSAPSTTTTTKKPATRGAAKSKQSKLDFSQKSGLGSQKAVEISDDEISDEDAFEPAPASSRPTRTRRR